MLESAQDLLEVARIDPGRAEFVDIVRDASQAAHERQYLLQRPRRVTLSLQNTAVLLLQAIEMLGQMIELVQGSSTALVSRQCHAHELLRCLGQGFQGGHLAGERLQVAAENVKDLPDPFQVFLGSSWQLRLVEIRLTPARLNGAVEYAAHKFHDGWTARQNSLKDKTRGELDRVAMALE